MAFSEPKGEALRQGDLIGSLRAYEVTRLEGEPAKPSGLLHTYQHAIVLTQDCDLEQDFGARFSEAVREDKLLQAVVLCGVHEYELVRAGTYRPGASRIRSDAAKIVRQNREPRYQYLGFVPQVGKCLVVDFKDFFALPCRLLYDELKSEGAPACRLASINSPYKEHIAQRYAWYSSRIGLPKNFDELVEPASAEQDV